MPRSALSAPDQPSMFSLYRATDDYDIGIVLRDIHTYIGYCMHCYIAEKTARGSYWPRHPNVSAAGRRRGASFVSPVLSPLVSSYRTIVRVAWPVYHPISIPSSQL